MKTDDNVNQHYTNTINPDSLMNPLKQEYNKFRRQTINLLHNY